MVNKDYYYKQIEPSLKCPPHLKCFAALPCEY